MDENNEVETLKTKKGSPLLGAFFGLIASSLFLAPFAYLFGVILRSFILLMMKDLGLIDDYESRSIVWNWFCVSLSMIPGILLFLGELGKKLNKNNKEEKKENE